MYCVEAQADMEDPFLLLYCDLADTVITLYCTFLLFIVDSVLDIIDGISSLLPEKTQERLSKRVDCVVDRLVEKLDGD